MRTIGGTGAEYDRRQSEKWDAWAAAADPATLEDCLRLQEGAYADLLVRHGIEMRGCLASLERIKTALYKARQRAAAGAEGPKV